MKTLSLFIVFTICSFTSFAQIYRDQWLAGGSVSFSHETQSAPGSNSSLKTTDIAIPINLGRFVANNFAIGFRGGYGYNKIQYPGNYLSKIESNSVNIGAFARYYFFPAASRINFLIDGSYTFAFTKQTTSYTSSGNYPYYVQQTSSGEVKSGNYILGIGPAFFLNSNVAVEILMAYRYSDYVESEVTVNNIFVGAGFQIHLGRVPVVK